MLQRRNYVRIDRKRFMPEDRGRIVTAFLQTTSRATSNTTSPPISRTSSTTSPAARSTGAQVLREFWKAFSAAVGETKDLRVSEVLDKLDEELGPHFFPANDNGGKSPRDCPACANGRLGLKLGKFGAFIGCSNYPECRYTRKLGIVDADAEAAAGANLDGPKVLGTDPATGKAVTLRNGPYGLYVQLGEAEGKEKPKRAVAAQGHDARRGHLGEGAGAARAAARARAASRGRRADPGRHRPLRPLRASTAPTTRSIPADESVLEIGMNRAVALLAEAKAPAAAAPPSSRIRTSATIPPTRRRSSSTGPLRPLREARRHQRHRAARPQAGRADARPGGVAAGRARGQGRRQEAQGRAAAKKAAPVPANDAGDTPPGTPKAAKKKAAPKRKAAKAAKAKAETPPRTGTDG